MLRRKQSRLPKYKTAFSWWNINSAKHFSLENGTMQNYQQPSLVFMCLPYTPNIFMQCRSKSVQVMLLPPIGKRKPILLWQQIKNTERRESGQRLNISDSSSYMCHSSQESLTWIQGSFGILPLRPTGDNCHLHPCTLHHLMMMMTPILNTFAHQRLLLESIWLQTTSRPQPQDNFRGDCYYQLLH